jgi:glycosyltransferase involved in cell wall biosynthesis
VSRRIGVLEVVRPSTGGMKRHVEGLIQGLDRDRFQVFLAAPKDEAPDPWESLSGVGYVPLGISGSMLAPSDVAACMRLRRLIRLIQPDICHFHGFKAAAAGRVAVATKMRTLGTPHVVYTVHNSVLSRPGIEISTQGPSARRRTQLLGSALQRETCRFLERALARLTHCVIVVSKALYKEYSTIPGLGSERVKYIPNGIDLHRFCQIASLSNQQREKAKTNLGCATGIPVIGLVARLIPHKGIKTFLLAMAYLKHMGLTPQVLIAGDGPSRAELVAFAEELGVSSQVRFLGFVEDMESFYAALDVFALSSLSEGMPLALVEAMASGVPIVAARTGGVEDLAVPGTGRLVAPGNPKAMADAVRDALLCPEESKIFAERARLHVRENSSIEKMVKETESVYEEVLSCRDSRDH